LKIIKRGTIPADRAYRVTCRNCETEFEFLRSEAELVPDQRDGDYLTSDCPMCHEECTTAI
jgi:hypothetical protein